MDEESGEKEWERCEEFAGMSLYQWIWEKKRRPNGREGWGKVWGKVGIKKERSS